MNKLTLNTNSWHYKFATFGGFNRYKSQDICTYTRRIAQAMIGIVMLSFIAMFLTWAAVEMIMGMAFSLYYGVYLFSNMGELGLLLFVAVMIVIATFFTVWVAHDVILNRAERVSDNFVSHAYKSWKNKYCVGVEFTDSKK